MQTDVNASVARFSFGLVLQVVVADDTIIASLVRIADEKVTSCTVNIKEQVADGGQDVLDKVVLASRIDEELIHPLFPVETKEFQQKKETPGVAKPDGGKGERDPPQPRGPLPGPLGIDPFANPLGGSDLDPLGRIGGGGMIFDPTRMHGRGRGLPRFDPVHPPIPDLMDDRRRSSRRNFGDDMPPPDFDNMFG